MLPIRCHAPPAMGPHPGNLYPVQRQTTRKATWKLLRAVVFLGGALVLGAAGAAQSASASSVYSVAQPSAGQGGGNGPPSEPSGHRPTSGTTSLLVKVNPNVSVDQVRQLVTDNGGSKR